MFYTSIGVDDPIRKQKNEKHWLSEFSLSTLSLTGSSWNSSQLKLMKHTAVRHRLR